MTSKHILLAILLLFSGISVSNAQDNSGTGQIEGVVTDAATGESLIGVNVTIKGTSIGAASDFNGHYVVRRVPSGNRVLVFSYIGYESLERPVDVSAGETIVVDAQLEQETVEGDEVIISAQRSGQQQAINQQITSDRIVNVVSEARIQELPNFNAAAAIGRLPSAGRSSLASREAEGLVTKRGVPVQPAYGDQLPATCGR